MPRLLLLFIFSLLHGFVHAQGISSSSEAGSLSAAATISVRRIEDEALKKYSFLERRIKKANDIMLARFEKQQEKIQRRLMKTDSAKALLLFHNAADRLTVAGSTAEQAMEKASTIMQQFATVDELNVAAGFLKTIRTGSSGLSAGMGKLEELKIKLAGLQGEMERAEAIKQYINERQQLLKEQLSGLNIGRHFDKINQQAGLYRQVIKDYRQILNEPGRYQQLATEQLRKIPAFNNFLRRHSALASLLPQNNEVPAVSQGMQTVESAALLLSNRLSGGAEGAVQAVTAQIQQVQQAFNGLLQNSAGNANTLDMPGYGPAKLKSKTFLQRIELGANVQFIRPGGIFPQTADIALQAGYMFSKKATAGVGVAYRLGMGQGFDKINFTNEGLGLRSFAEFKLKGNLYINGGFEQNYNTAFDRFEELKNRQRWMGSALAGISKKTNGPKKLKTQVQLLYDFLHHTKQPASQPLLFRVGYTFK